MSDAVEGDIPIPYDEGCKQCRLHQHAELVCEPGIENYDWGGAHRSMPNIMVVSRMPNSPSYQEALVKDLKEAGINPGLCFFTAAIKCRQFDIDPSKTDLKACKSWYDIELETIQPEYVLALGNEALWTTTGHSGIMKYRGKIIDRGRTKVLPTISPASVARNPGQRNGFMADLRLLALEIRGESAKIKPPKISIIDTNEKFAKLKKAIEQADLVSFDIETTGDTEFDPEGRIVSVAGTLVIDDKLLTWAMPLYHPQSPFRKSWQKAVQQLTRRMAKVPKRLAQNGKFDCRWLRHFSGCPIDITFDTMLASHLLDENREKGLKTQGASRLGVAPWGIDTRDLLSYPISEVLEYNALDCYYAYHIYLLLRAELIEQPRLLRIFTTITMPAANELIGVEQRGMWVDREKLATNGHVARKMLAEIEDQLMDHVPEQADVDWPTNSKGKPVEVNFNASNFARWFLFRHLGMPILATGKTKQDGSMGDPSMAEDVMLQLKGEHPVIDLMLERAGWQKMVSAFFNSYDELLDENDRVHTTFKVAGTVTGRLSSGKADAEKITAQRGKRRGLNIQQVPRDPLVRGIFGAPPGYTFVEADFSQIELRIAAYLSRDRTMLSLYQQGEDIHAATASWVLGIPRSQVTKDDRKKAKAVNFGFVYGMGWRKFIYTAFTKYGVTFTEAQAQDIRRLFFEQFSGLQAWHARQRRLVNENRRVQNPIGRIRHLPDIDSPEDFVRGEAERQAINSPVQSFGSDLCMLSMTLIEQQFRRDQLDAHTNGTVHDSLLFEVRNDHLAVALPVIKHTMENLPLEEKFGCVLDVPIVADITVGQHWGEGRELTEAEIYDWSE